MKPSILQVRARAPVCETIISARSHCHLQIFPTSFIHSDSFNFSNSSSDLNLAHPRRAESVGGLSPASSSAVWVRNSNRLWSLLATSTAQSNADFPLQGSAVNKAGFCEKCLAVLSPLLRLALARSRLARFAYISAGLCRNIFNSFCRKKAHFQVSKNQSESGGFHYRGV